MKIVFELFKETPGKYRYAALSGGAMIETIYVRKDAFPNGPPKHLTVTVEASE